MSLFSRDNHKVRHHVFWPPFLLLIVSVSLLFYDNELFLNIFTIANSWLLDKTGWLFSLTGLLMVGLILFVYFSKIGDVKIGGKDAEPLLNRFNWFAVVLSTTVAIGILFWASAEPIYHYLNPPEFLNIEPESPHAVIFSLSTMYLHWTFTPYALYSVPALMFSLAYYNLKKPFSLGSTLVPVFGNKINTRYGWLIDTVSLYTLVVGMAASLGTGIMTLAGGFTHFWQIESGASLYAVLVIAVVGTFIVSASSGLMKGIRILSDLNLKFFFILIAFMFVVGPTAYLLNIGTEAFGRYMNQFIERSVYTGVTHDSDWPHSWTTFYWANWLAWTPITAIFLGRIGYGYTVKEFIRMNFFLPAGFGILWITVFSGSALYMQEHVVDLAQILTEQGPELITYAIFDNLPLAQIIIPFFLFISFISFVTAADSNTSAMSGISNTGITPENPEASTLMKIVWGSAIGLTAWVIISAGGVEGIKMLSNLGGLPALILELFIGWALIVYIRSYKKDSLPD